MRKTALALIMTIVLFSTVFFSQTPSLVNANPVGWPWKQNSPRGYPIITVTSPWGIYPQDNVWLNFTVTKPSKWTDLGGQLDYAGYLVDGELEFFSRYTFGEDKVITIQDSLGGVANPPLEFNFSLKLNGLSEGQHHVDLYVEGHVLNDGVNTPVGALKTMDFIVRNEFSLPPTPSPTQDYGLKLSSPQQIAVLSGTIAVACIVLLAYYFKKWQRGKSP
jgi:hypothetical protein